MCWGDEGNHGPFGMNRFLVRAVLSVPGDRPDVMADLKEELHRKLKAGRAALLSRLEGLGEYDLRRPMTPTGTNLLGLVKHLAGLEYGYLGESPGRPGPETLPWVEDGSIWDGAHSGVLP